MISKLIAYEVPEVTKKLSLSKAKSWYKAGLVAEDQWDAIQKKYHSNLYTPKLAMRIFLFFLTVLGIQMVLGPIALMIDFDSSMAWRIALVLVGVGSLTFSETVMIRRNHHFKSGVTEACYYVGASFTATGLLGFDIDEPILVFIVGLLIFTAGTVRYLDLLSVVGAVSSLIAILFIIFESMMAFIPFVIMVAFAGLFLLSQELQKKVANLIWEDHFILFDSLALLLVYLGGNYFVVRELSIEMMGVNLSAGEDIPFAFLFYAFTFFIPIAYLIWGIMKRKVLFIRISLLALALTVITIMYYYSSGYYEFTVTLIGGLMTLIAFGLINYLKQSRNGYSREKLLTNKWDNSDLGAFLASQTLGGHQINEADSVVSDEGGEFGGGGASGGF